ncbi:hypothetical protein BDV24DRAFT_162248 [Aspergillus arachidicola]|uniref:Apple domain-containing protein n=1 Tax=Aspergillus arachidicola TaxID=656916 RepID=A0A5N6YE03_9EURO|nr:hypothetical protein BDV24DRAFT_162248 [Aspergillus arachidicola]
MNAGQDPLIFNTKTLHHGELEYNRICPHLNGTTADIAPGYTVRFYCDMHSAAESWDRQGIDGLSSAEECAELCEARDYCHASFWKKAEGTGWLAHTRKLANKPKPGYVLMVPLEQSEVDPGNIRQPITVAGRKYQLYYDVGWSTPLAKPHSPQPNFPTFRQCLQECSSNANCLRLNYWFKGGASPGACNMISNRLRGSDLGASGKYTIYASPLD